LEIETANLRLIKNMADRLTHEIGNAMVPLSTHQQLLADKWKDAEFRASLDVALADGVKRVTRLINQMRFLARDAMVSPEAFSGGSLLEEAYQEARKYQPAKAGQLNTIPAALLSYLLVIVPRSNKPSPKSCSMPPGQSDGPENWRPNEHPHRLAMASLPCKSKCRTTAQVSPPRPSKKVQRRSSPRAMSVWGLA